MRAPVLTCGVWPLVIISLAVTNALRLCSSAVLAADLSTYVSLTRDTHTHLSAAPSDASKLAHGLLTRAHALRNCRQRRASVDCTCSCSHSRAFLRLGRVKGANASRAALPHKLRPVPNLCALASLLASRSATGPCGCRVRGRLVGIELSVVRASMARWEDDKVATPRVRFYGRVASTRTVTRSRGACDEVLRVRVCAGSCCLFLQLLPPVTTFSWCATLKSCALGFALSC